MVFVKNHIFWDLLMCHWVSHFFDCLTLMIKMLWSFEISGTTHPTTLYYNPEDLNLQFLGEFTKLQKATISFMMSVCPFAWNNSAPIGWLLMKFDTLVFFENLSRKFKFH